ncbi:condensation domain-containing protein [Streptomyces sp. NPDC002669]|uniref:condensation domain-containing protein n=1 Tax=Streptomyces sp. NPDC002669 TaxID=3364658 RepID=UPI0036981EBD
MTVVVDPGEPPYDAPPFLELRGPLDTRSLEAALDRLAARRPDGPAWQHRLRPHGPGLHTLRLTMGAPGEFPAGLLADLLTDPPLTGRCVRTAGASPLQLELLADADAHPGTGRHVEQLAWDWHGPLDPERFTAAWQSLFDRESVLRSAFDDGPEPRIVVHDRVRAEVVRLPHSTEDWASVVEYDRRRGLDPRRPGPLRVTVLGGGPLVSVTAPPTRVLLTYHHALLDDWSARLLLREFYRAYLADGLLPGGERRPDMDDYTQWLARQDVGPAREFWTDAAPPPDAAHSPLPHTPDTPGASDPSASTSAPAFHGTGTGTGRTRLRLTAAQTARLGAWAAGWGSTESGALQAVWALLLYRATGSADPRPVRFSVTVSGRGIPFDSVERLPGSLRNPLPMSVVVDPRSSVPALLALLRDRALDMAAYEWVSAGRIRGWTESPDRPAGPEGSLVAFDGRPRNADGLAPELAARGIRVGHPETLGAHTAFPLTLAAHHDEAGGLVMTVTYDRTQLAGIGGVLAHAAYLLDELPRIAGEFTTVAEVLELLSAADLDAGASTDTGTGTGAEVCPATDGGAESGAGDSTGTGAGAGGASAIITLRPSRKPGVGTVCLVPAHSTPRFRHDLLARSYRGPESLVLLGTPPDDARAGYDALRPLIDAGGPLVLGGFTGCGVAAYGITRLIAENGGRPPLIVLTGTATSAADLARLLESAAERAG